jgi:hypothetical protein
MKVWLSITGMIRRQNPEGKQLCDALSFGFDMPAGALAVSRRTSRDIRLMPTDKL